MNSRPETNERMRDDGLAGLYVIGDASRGMPQVTTAVSGGAMTAIMVSKVLFKEGAQRV